MTERPLPIEDMTPDQRVVAAWLYLEILEAGGQMLCPTADDEIVIDGTHLGTLQVFGPSKRNVVRQLFPEIRQILREWGSIGGIYRGRNAWHLLVAREGGLETGCRVRILEPVAQRIADIPASSRVQRRCPRCETWNQQRALARDAARERARILTDPIDA